jgi:hypothetical protein
MEQRRYITILNRTGMCSHACIKSASLIHPPFVMFVFPALNTFDIAQSFVASGLRCFKISVIFKYQDR